MLNNIIPATHTGIQDRLSISHEMAITIPTGNHDVNQNWPKISLFMR